MSVCYWIPVQYRPPKTESIMYCVCVYGRFCIHVVSAATAATRARNIIVKTDAPSSRVCVVLCDARYIVLYVPKTRWCPLSGRSFNLISRTRQWEKITHIARCNNTRRIRQRFVIVQTTIHGEGSRTGPRTGVSEKRYEISEKESWEFLGKKKKKPRILWNSHATRRVKKIIT